MKIQWIQINRACSKSKCSCPNQPCQGRCFVVISQMRKPWLWEVGLHSMWVTTHKVCIWSWLDVTAKALHGILPCITQHCPGNVYVLFCLWSQHSFCCTTCPCHQTHTVRASFGDWPLMGYLTPTPCLTILIYKWHSPSKEAKMCSWQIPACVRTASSGWRSQQWKSNLWERTNSSATLWTWSLQSHLQKQKKAVI